MKPALTTPAMTNVGENVVRIEAEALKNLADRISGPMAASFARAIDQYAIRFRPAAIKPQEVFCVGVFFIGHSSSLYLTGFEDGS